MIDRLIPRSAVMTVRSRSELPEHRFLATDPVAITVRILESFSREQEMFLASSNRVRVARRRTGIHRRQKVRVFGRGNPRREVCDELSMTPNAVYIAKHRILERLQVLAKNFDSVAGDSV